MSAGTSCVPIRIHGRYLWRGDNRFFVRGVAYQVRSVFDSISDDRLPQLKHDITLFKELGLNTLFVFSINNTKTHTEAMKLLEEAGIYVLITVSTPSCAINRQTPYESYNSSTVTSFFKTLDVMASYPNTLGLLAASETVNNEATLSATPVIKATVRDLKKYMKLKNEVTGQRVLPVGYDAAMSSARDKMILDYLAGGDSESSIDFWTCKGFSWVGESSMAQSGYNDLINQLDHATIPIFFSEYGNNSHQPRLFQETTAIYSPFMSRVFSGGCAYEFWQGANRYGLVEMRGQNANTKLAAYQQSPDDRKKVFEKRETDQGLLLIYHDFANYRANLAAVTDVEANWDHELVEYEVKEMGGVDMTQKSWPWEPEFHEPESCIDWAEIEKLVRSKV